MVSHKKGWEITPAVKTSAVSFKWGFFLTKRTSRIEHIILAWYIDIKRMCKERQTDLIINGMPARSFFCLCYPILPTNLINIVLLKLWYFDVEADCHIVIPWVKRTLHPSFQWPSSIYIFKEPDASVHHLFTITTGLCGIL